MMLILLLIGVSAGMVMLAFPASRDDSAAQARFEAQLRFVQQRGLQTGQFFGASLHPDRCQVLVLLPR